MRRIQTPLGRVAVLALAVMLAGAPLMAAGFSIFEQGAKAMGMAGAFTATADDPSAMYHNVGGLAFLDKGWQVGATIISSSGAEFEGAAPFPGEGVTEDMESLMETPPHAYWVRPLNDRWTFGLAVNAPFGLATEWDPKVFSGRYISTLAAVTSIDISPNFGWQVSEKFGVGFGLLYRSAKVELERIQPSDSVNPFTGAVADIAEVALESDLDSGIGWQAGFLHRVNNSFSWGFSYRSAVEIDFGGEGQFTQIPTGYPQFDFGVAQVLPFGTKVPLAATIEFPATASLGFAMALSRNWRMEIDANWTGWGDFQQVDLDFGGVLPTSEIVQNWEDANNYRLGFRWIKGPKTEWRFGYVFDETPQPLETMGPLLPDGDRNGFTIGYGHTGAKNTVDVAFMYLPIDERTTLVNQDKFNGTYDTEAVLFSVSVGR